MFNVNRATLLGNVTHDPEVHVTKSGRPLVTLGLATNRSWRDTQGELKKEAEFHNLVCFGPLAEFAGKSVAKGSPLYIEGRLRTGHWETPEGKNASRTEIIADRIVLLSSTKKGEMNAAEAPTEAEAETEA